MQKRYHAIRILILLQELRNERGHGPAAAPNSALLQRELDGRGIASEIVPFLKKLGLGAAAGAGTTILGDELGGERLVERRAGRRGLDGDGARPAYGSRCGVALRD